MIHVELDKLNYKHIWFDIYQINIIYENGCKCWKDFNWKH